MSSREILFVVYEIALFGSAVAALWFYKSLRQKKIALLVPYLVYVFAQEFLMHNFYSFFLGDMRNDIVYNLYRLISVIVFSIIFYQQPVLASARKYIAGLAILYIVVFLVNFTLIQSIFVDNNYLGLARGSILTFYGLLFLFNYFNLDSRREEKFWSPLMWLSIGIVIFYPVVSISQMFQSYLLEHDASVFGFKLYNLIPQVMSIFMYSCFGYAFFLCKKRS